MFLILNTLIRYSVRFIATSAVIAPTFMVLIGYTRDVVRIYNLRILTSAIELSYYGNGNAHRIEMYPRSLQEISGTGKLLSFVPEDPSTGANLEPIAKLAAAYGIPNFIIDPSVTPENGYQFEYVPSKNLQKYELSTRLESPFSLKKMQQDGGDNPERYEVGNDLKIAPVVRYISGAPVITEIEAREQLNKLKLLDDSFGRLLEGVGR
jgi:hypothetical protein